MNEYRFVISDILTATIVVLMAVLVIYPATRALWRSWQRWHRRHPRHDEALPRR